MFESRGITHELTPPDTPQYNRVAERALGLLREKSIAILQMTVARSDRLRDEALNYASYDTSDVCVTSSVEGGTSTY